MAHFNLEQIKEGWLLIDSNFLMNYYKYIEGEEFSSFILELKKFKIEAITTQHVVYEILSSCSSLQEYEAQKNFVNQIVSMVVEDKAEIMASATTISNIYQNKKVKDCGAKMVDCLLSAQLKNYGQKLTLLTANFKDFPLILHNRLGLRTIDVGQQVITFAFLTFNHSKYNTAYLDLEKAHSANIKSIRQKEEMDIEPVPFLG